MNFKINKDQLNKVSEKLGWFGASFVILGYYLNANHNISCWAFWIVGNTLIGLYSLNKKTYPTAVMSLLLVLFNIYGYLKWLNS